MLCLKRLVVALLVMALCIFSATKSDPIKKQKWALRAEQRQAPLEGEHCWLGGRVRRPRSVPQHHPFARYPRKQVENLGGIYPGRERPSKSKGCNPVAEEWEGSYVQPDSPKRETRSILPAMLLDSNEGIETLPRWQKDSGDGQLGPLALEDSSSQSEISEPASVIRTEEKANSIFGDGDEEDWERSQDRTPRHVEEGSREDPMEIQNMHFHHRSSQRKGLFGWPMGQERLSGSDREKNWEELFLNTREELATLYFSGKREQLLVHPDAVSEIPRAEFTVEVWVKPEGGQGNPAIIAGLFDNCSHAISDKGWALGIRTVQHYQKKDAHFFFSLRTDQMKRGSTITGYHRYQLGTWTQIAASYNGQQMTLYVDGIQVASSFIQSGALHSSFMASCRTLFLGGDNSERGNNFRGHLGSLTLWRTSQTQKQLKHHLLEKDKEEDATLVFNANFAQFEEEWIPFKNSGYPLLEILPVPKQDILSPLIPPPCGQTICDNVELITNYNQYWPLRSEKVIRYRVVNICEDDGRHPMVSHDQISHQHQALIEAFGRYNISWQLTVHEVRNSSLRHRTILVNCEPSKIGNDHCDPECEHPLTGYDGGDCRFNGRCYSWKKRDGICHMECNNMLDDFDDGDCCDPEVTDVKKTCFDPDSPERTYMSVKELKEVLQLNNTHFLNVYFANSVREELAGAATWPWDKEALSHLGGVVLNPSYYGMPGHTNIMIHEVGHTLGLYHVFKGVSERESCDDPCRETAPSMETGDLCADTAPTPKSKLCRDPEPINDTCGQIHFSGTPFNNYMSYTDDDCTNSFTQNQVSRMHCYLDLVYQRWNQKRKPAPIPMPPLIIQQSLNSITIHWLPPISGALYERDPGTLCGDCTEDGSFHQYVHEASSPRVCDSSGYWTPEEAVGPPDVEEPCEPSLQAWSPELHLYHMNMTVPCPQPHGCVLELRFLHPVYPETLTLWTTYLSTNSPKALSNVEVLTELGESIHLGALDTYCDMPLTVKLTVDRKVSGVRVYTFDERMEIDAALLTSKPQNPLCAICRPVQYRVLRDPPFYKDSPVTGMQAHQKFTDMDVTPGQVYRYQVQVVVGMMLGEASPPLVHMHGAPYCGDGLVTALGEECDDGNLLDWDGCSKKCAKEKGFNCIGEPSLCYVHDGDGVCESFERESSTMDCGFYTPKGYTDQWASVAYTSHQHPRQCPVSMVIGEPAVKSCKPLFPDLPEHQFLGAWFPCSTRESESKDTEDENEKAMTAGGSEQEETVWLKVHFDRPGVATSVLVYQISNSNVPNDQHKPTVTIHLTDMAGSNHSLGTHDLSCQQYPLVVNVTHGLNFPFYRTASVFLNFSSPLVGISAVALRTFSHLSSVVPSSCLDHEGHSNQKHSCSARFCIPLQVDHASVTCTSSGPGRMKCSVNCERGFALHNKIGQGFVHLQKEDQLTCTFGRWDRLVTCDPIVCELPDQSLVYYATFSCPEGTAFGKCCAFSCIPPSKLQVLGMNYWVTCLEDGLWSLPEAYCKLECDAPPLIAHAKLLQPHYLEGNHDVGSVCHYKCKPGYYVAENTERKPRKKFLKIQCLQSGFWEEGSCVPIICEQPHPVFEGMYNCTQGFKLDSQCILNCNSQNERVPILCTKEGVWTEEFKLCDNLQGECPPPPEFNLVEYKCDQGYGIGAVCIPSCIIPPSDPVLLSGNFTAETVEHWMIPTKVESIVCTGMLRWHPEPENLHCIQSCEPFQADGWCDTINNRAYCQYDGGDCCASTLSSRKVIPFAADCDHDECTCRDPDAKENQQQRKHLQQGLR
ncbi:pappalysin-2 [Rhinatrema bivittatum]|uniref:pappalysin-2 n=1 Tax=Rhinatrema bivittatum TaxID=194408 RepID=UPI00112C6988|nr:pappalysin-2 [Rhinatrema bivittatum]XP_029474618.1 pappalysin-2 [Rhinatrema bivittatum]